MKRTYQPSNLRRKRTHSFLKRMSTKGGRLVLKRRRAKGRKRLVVEAQSYWDAFNCQRSEPGQVCPPYTLRKEERVRSRTDFLRISKEGERYQTEHFQVSICPNHLSYRRLGIAVGKRVGKAVERNRLKRIIREVFRLNKAELLPSSDFVITGKKGAAGLNFSQVAKELKGIIEER